VGHDDKDRAEKVDQQNFHWRRFAVNAPTTPVLRAGSKGPDWAARSAVLRFRRADD
jgi:hypothetical protein